MNHLLEYLRNNQEKHLSELIEFLKIPSISSEKEHDADTRKCGEWITNHLKNIGFKNAALQETDGHPILYAEWLEAGSDKPTVLIYGHYDVQPVDPLNLWDSPPFEPVIKDGKIFARGTADDKGQLFAHIKALEAHFAVNGKLPVNVKLLIEGEEECGSDNLDKFILENKDKLSCDTVLISDTEWFADGLPSICYSLRGIAFVEVELTGPNRDLHSGTFGGAVANPINELCDIIAKLKDENGRITIPGFYDDVLELTIEERESFAKLPFDLEYYKKDLNVKALRGEKGFSTLERVWARPTLDVNGIKGGYQGDGAKTVLPSKASAKISMRLVPNQKSDDIAKKITEYLQHLAPPSVKINVNILHGGEPVLVPFDSKSIRAAMDSLKKAFKTQPVLMREGGSIPIVGLFKDILNAEVVLMGLGLPGDNIHSPNENFTLNNFYGGIYASAIFMEEINKK